MPSAPDPLDRLLNEWNEVPPPSPRLESKVWQSIATGHHPEKRTWWQWCELWLSRPVGAIGFVSVCVLAGLLFAELHVSELQRERSAELAKSYLLLIDPLLAASMEERP